MQLKLTRLPAVGQAKSASSCAIGKPSFNDFASLSRQRAWTAQSLADRFRGKIENPAEFFHRVLEGKSPDSPIPYRSVIEFFAASQEIAAQGNAPACACGCGRTVFDRKRYALPGCKTRTARRKASGVTNAINRDGQNADFVDARRRQLGVTGRLPLTSSQHGAERKAGAANG